MDRLKSAIYRTGVVILWVVMAATTVHALHNSQQPSGITGK